MKGKLVPIILISAVAVLLLGGVWFFLSKANAPEEKKELSADEIIGNSVETQPFTTNLRSGGFIQLRFKIQANSEKAKEELTKRDFQVRNLALKLASSMTEEQVQSPEGMEAFEQEMKEELNKLMQNGKIIEIYTINKVIQ